MFQVAVGVLVLDYIFSSTKNRFFLCSFAVLHDCSIFHSQLFIDHYFDQYSHCFFRICLCSYTIFFTPLWSIVVWVANNLKVSEILTTTTMIETMIETMMTMTVTVMITTMLMMTTRRSR